MAGKTEPLGELADALLDGHRFSGVLRLRYWRGQFWLWEPSQPMYVPLGSEAFSDYCLQWLRRQRLSCNPDTAERVAKLVRAEVRLPEDLEMPCWLDLDDELLRRETGWLSMQNGMILPRERALNDDTRLQPHSPRWFSGTLSEHAFDPAAKCPQYLTWLELMLDRDPERLLLWQEWLGYLLTPDTSRQVSMFLTGPEGTGKSTLAETACVMVGKKNCSMLSLAQFGDKFSPAATIGKTLNWADEGGEPGRGGENTLKWFIGAKEMMGRRMYADPFQMRPTARLLVSINVWPRFQDPTGAVWRRILHIPMLHKIPRERHDPQLPAKLALEMPGIINWAIRGLARLCRSGWTKCSIGERLIAEQREADQSWHGFIRECLREEPGGFCSTQQLHAAYVSWCGRHLIKLAADPRLLMQEVQTAMPQCRTARKQDPTSGTRLRGLEGITLVEDQA